MDREKVIKGLNDIGGFIAGRNGFEQARNFLRTIDDALALIDTQYKLILELQNLISIGTKICNKSQDEQIKGRRMSDTESMGVLFDDPPDGMDGVDTAVTVSRRRNNDSSM